MKNILVAGLIVFSSILIPAGVAFAETGTTAGVNPGTTAGTNPAGETAKLQNPIKYDTFAEFVAAVTQAAVEILVPFLVLAFIWAGFLFVKAQGNQAELDKAKGILWYSMIGAFILMGAWGFASIIGDTVTTITQP